MIRRLTLLLALALVAGSLAPDAAFADRSGNGRGHRPTVTPADAVFPVAASDLASVAGWYIVQTKPAAGDPGQVAKALARKYNLTLKNVYRAALTGFAAKVPDGKLATLEADPAVAAAEPDRAVQLIDPTKKKKHIGPVQTASNDGPQVTPFGIERIQAPENTVWQTQKAAGVDAAVAVIDTGVWKEHPDLNVVGGINCSSSDPGDPNDFADHYGHGTHVSGTIGAKDNGFGVIGVAPGAAIYAVKVLNDNGVGATSDVICGLNWVAANADDVDVANMSLGGKANPNQAKGCDDPNVGAEEKAICNVVGAGIPVVVAAGNECKNADGFSPALYDAVIAVGAFGDDDGEPGGLGNRVQRAPACPKPNVRVPDDTLAPFTNYGDVVDIWAPGDGVLSTVPPANVAILGNDAEYDSRGWSGTSMATPHVTGSAALFIAGYRADHGGNRPSVEDVRHALLNPGSAGHPGAEQAVIENARFKKSGSKQMPRQVNALIVNDNSDGPWGT
ncbi:MAG TPA: S8 family serine peptidase [Thermomicrobiales bacterium]|nr:S8 family serine peptidase [Thermomicrobiales bacterium]